MVTVSSSYEEISACSPSLAAVMFSVASRMRRLSATIAFLVALTVREPVPLTVRVPVQSMALDPR